jgi:small subunit ribosomal protein S16
MVRIRLRRVGAKHKPIYRVVVADSRMPREGAFIEVIGHYNPLADPEAFDIDEQKALKWLGNGAKPSDTVERLLFKAGIMEKFKPGYVRPVKMSKPKAAVESSEPSTTKEA